MLKIQLPYKAISTNKLYLGAKVSIPGVQEVQERRRGIPYSQLPEASGSQGESYDGSRGRSIELLS